MKYRNRLILSCIFMVKVLEEDGKVRELSVRAITRKRKKTKENDTSATHASYNCGNKRTVESFNVENRKREAEE